MEDKTILKLQELIAKSKNPRPEYIRGNYVIFSLPLICPNAKCIDSNVDKCQPVFVDWVKTKKSISYCNILNGVGEVVGYNFLDWDKNGNDVYCTGIYPVDNKIFHYTISSGWNYLIRFFDHAQSYYRVMLVPSIAICGKDINKQNNICNYFPSPSKDLVYLQPQLQFSEQSKLPNVYIWEGIHRFPALAGWDNYYTDKDCIELEIPF